MCNFIMILSEKFLAHANHMEGSICYNHKSEGPILQYFLKIKQRVYKLLIFIKYLFWNLCVTAAVQTYRDVYSGNKKVNSCLYKCIDVWNVAFTFGNCLAKLTLFPL
jgi:hypothetical protein